jgi:hypothetical protein
VTWLHVSPGVFSLAGRDAAQEAPQRHHFPNVRLCRIVGKN